MYKNVSSRTKAVFSRCLKPFKKQESHEAKECGNCCCHLKKKVFLKGFAEITKSKRCRRIAIKLFVCFICASGFLYQAWRFLQMYLAYPTTLETSEEYPDSFIAPAITICNRNRLLRQPYCETYPEKCTWEHTTWDSFCNKYRRMCPETKPPDFNFGIPEYEYYYRKNGTNLVLSHEWSDEKSNIITKCYQTGNYSFMDCRSNITVIPIPKNGLKYRCLTIYSLLEEHHGGQFNMTLSDGYQLTLDMHPEEHFNTIQLVEASIVLHDPRKAVNPMIKGITLTSGKSYQLFPTMERTERLPPPYASNCIDYLKLWKKNGGYGALSKDDCISHCIIKATLAESNCVPHEVSYPHNYPICELRLEDVSYEVYRLCTSGCRDACDEHSYHLSLDTLSNLEPWCNATDEHCKSQELGISIRFNQMKVKKFKQIPKFESIELFSYIGGYLGMWLGISLASVFHLTEMMYDVIDKAFLKKRKQKSKRKQKTTTRIEQSPHHTAVKKEKNYIKRRKLSC